MKHRILTLALLLSISITSTFANISNDAVKNYKAANAFKREFTQAQDVKWEETKEFSGEV